jgi:hypothetical protein
MQYFSSAQITTHSAERYKDGSGGQDLRDFPRRRRDHEDDEQNKEYVDQWSYVDIWRGNEALNFAHLYPPLHS